MEQIQTDMPLALDPALAAHPGFRRMFAPGALTLGLMHPIEAYAGSVATMQDQIPLAQRAEALGFAALWLRDVPLHDPYFGDAGQIYDTWVYLGWLAAQTRTVSLATGAVVLPLRHPLHVAKAAASVDQLSGGRLVLGVASGDRPLEYPAFGADFETRGERFQDSLAYLHAALENSFPAISSPLGQMAGDVDLLPKPFAGRLPILVTGASRQSPDWIADHADGWLQYFRPPEQIARLLALSRGLAQQYKPGVFVPYTQGFGHRPRCSPPPDSQWPECRTALAGRVFRVFAGTWRQPYSVWLEVWATPGAGCHRRTRRAYPAAFPRTRIGMAF